MDSNDTLTNQLPIVPPPSFTTTIIPLLGFITFGLIGCLLSDFISISLSLKSVELRQGQRRILLTMMEIANFSLNSSYVLAGSFRLKYVMTGEYALRVSAWECMIRIYSPFFSFAFPFVTMMLFANAAERFLAVSYPIIYYHKVKTKHQVIVSLLVVIYSTLATLPLVAYICSYNLDQAPIWPYTCLTASAVGQPYITYYYTHGFIFVIFSAPISLATVLALIRKSKIGDTNFNNGLPSVYLGKQKALTHAMVLATAVVFLLMCPACTSYFIISGLHIAPLQWVELLLPYVSLIIAAHSIVNDIILCSMNRQVRNSVKELYQMIILSLKKIHIGQTSNGNQIQVTNNRA